MVNLARITMYIECTPFILHTWFSIQYSNLFKISSSSKVFKANYTCYINLKMDSTHVGHWSLIQKVVYLFSIW